MKMLPSTVSTNTKPLSGAVCEDVWNLTEMTGLLTLLPGFGDHEREQSEACIGDSTPETLLATAANLSVVKHIWPRLSSAAIFSLRAWSLSQFYISQEAAIADPILLEVSNEAIMESRLNYKADCTMFLQLFELHFPETSLSTNAHAALCRAVHEMMMMGAIVPDLGIERTVNKFTTLLFLDA
jgi:hypothetical protein